MVVIGLRGGVPPPFSDWLPHARLYSRPNDPAAAHRGWGSKDRPLPPPLVSPARGAAPFHLGYGNSTNYPSSWNEGALPQGGETRSRRPARACLLVLRGGAAPPFLGDYPALAEDSRRGPPAKTQPCGILVPFARAARAVLLAGCRHLLPRPLLASNDMAAKPTAPHAIINHRLGLLRMYAVRPSKSTAAMPALTFVGIVVSPRSWAVRGVLSLSPAYPAPRPPRSAACAHMGAWPPLTSI